MSDHGDAAVEEPLNPADSASEFNDLLKTFKAKYDRQNKSRFLDEDETIKEERERKDEILDEKRMREDEAKKKLREAERDKYVLHELKAYYNNSLVVNSEEDNPVAADEDGLDRAEPGPSRVASRAITGLASQTINKDEVKSTRLWSKLMMVSTSSDVGSAATARVSSNQLTIPPPSPHLALHGYEVIWTRHARDYHKMTNFGREYKETFGTKVVGADAKWWRDHVVNFYKHRRSELKKARETRDSHTDQDNHLDSDLDSDAGLHDNAPQPEPSRGGEKYDLRRQETANYMSTARGKMPAGAKEQAVRGEDADEIQSDEDGKQAARKKKNTPAKFSKGKAPAIN
ncbi:hypothetical protein BKA64DRAFT_699195 [Cadophora sp. MPI-SDFR-AT-0126]|nr:hypothetical protein BKA64DRAFT_699195 [Leotiomycetes sp. MPI-SDFR-AT-0126]